jgi:hypothetical protein
MKMQMTPGIEKNTIISMVASFPLVFSVLLDSGDEFDWQKYILIEYAYEQQ